MQKFKALLFFVVLLFGYTYTFATSGAEEKIKLNIQDKPRVEALNSITEQTGLRFSYNPQNVNTNEIITVHTEETTLDKALNTLLPESITYRQKGKYIILLPKEELAIAENNIPVDKKEASALEKIPQPDSTLLMQSSSHEAIAKHDDRIKELAKANETEKNASHQNKPSSNAQKINLTGVESIEIDYSIDNIYVFESESDELVVLEYLTQNVREAYAWTQSTDRIVTIKNGKRKLWLFDQPSLIEVHVPVGYKGNLKISTVNGNVTIVNDLKLNSLMVKTASGYIEANTITAGNIDLKTASNKIVANELIGNTIINSTTGRIVINNIRGERVNITNISNAIEVDSIFSTQSMIKNSASRISINYLSGAVQATSLNGLIAIRSIKGHGNIETSFGGIYLGFKEVDGNINVKSTSGKISVGIPDNLPFRFDATTKNGFVNAFFLETNNHKAISRQVGSSPAVQITINNASGGTEVWAYE